MINRPLVIRQRRYMTRPLAFTALWVGVITLGLSAVQIWS